LALAAKLLFPFVELIASDAQLKCELRSRPLAKLKQTNWWQPYPEKIRWIPDMDDWDRNYEKLMPDMRRVLGWKR
ncbi:MAG: hypothetical protein ACXWC1_34170, partial [Burkholderiales bacterium]